MTMSRRARVALVVSLALAALAGCTSAAPPDPARSPAADGSGRDVGIEMFQWTWDSIARECTDQIGPAGYAWVLTSPPQEHVLGEQWWTSYQPVSYLVESRLGTREQFAEMVRTCHAAGVQVWTDAVLNHMTGQDAPGTGWAGSSFSHYEYPGIWTRDDFHHCGLTAGDDIADYHDADQVQTCELLNLADLDTGSTRVRERLTRYLQDLLSLGVDGFRIDAAKHMAPQDVAAILAPLPAGTGIVQEVIRGTDEPVQPEQYLANGKVYEFTFAKELEGVLAGTPGLFLDLGSATARYVPSKDAVVFVDDHDTERDGSTLAYPDQDYLAANVLMLAGAYGTPEVMSGYAFSDRDAGPPQDAKGLVLDASCASDVGPVRTWQDGDRVCQHRWPQIAAMVAWRAVVGDAAVVDTWSDGDAVAFGRGERGLVVVNAGDQALTTTLHTSLADASYCDVLASSCTATKVSDGQVTVTVPAHGAAAFDVAHLAP
ncbi:alpha-amylase family protein [Cellulomonas sp. HZM]|uniref:alpha-amylase n=1 Tax=Cellulomonas sp. HZM TaxID=1454010 RepID=UPI0004939CA8|nr:alpha-amylase family protein [Cellulomonas sp. HZM]